MKLQQKLFLVIGLVTVVPLLVLLFGVVERMESNIELRVSEEMQQTLDRLAQELSTLMASQQSLAQGLGRVPAVKELAQVAYSYNSETYEAFDARATELAAFFLNYQSTVPSIQALRYVDLDGKALIKIKEGSFIEPRKSGEQGLPYVEDISEKEFFKQALNDVRQSVTISDFERGKVAAEVDFCPAMVRYTVPIKDELDLLLGYIVVNMWGRRIDNTVEVSLGGYPGKVYIVEQNSLESRDGIYLYHADQGKRFSNQLDTSFSLPQDVGEVAWNKIKLFEGFNTLKLADGKILFVRKFRPYHDRDSQWQLVIETTRDTVLSPIAGLRASIWVLMGILLLLSLIAARWVSVRMARPVRELAEIITQYADGKHASRYKEQRTDEIGLVGKAFNYMAENLEHVENERDKARRSAQQSERLAAVGQMAAGIGHEINNPIMNIMSLASLMDKDISGEQEALKKDIQAIQKEGLRCSRIVQGILNFARESEPRYENFDMAVLINDTVALLQHKFDRTGISLDINLEQPLYMDGDSGQLQQVLVNILLNAAHASPDNSSIGIRALKDNSKIVLEISDQGSGISESVMMQVFDPFFTTREEGKGSGLGLSVSYGIIKKHGGMISMDNREDRGVVVRIVLPVQTSQDMEGSVDQDMKHVG